MHIHLLDMGQTKYGDCILITKDDRTIMIDGGHPTDTASIRMQLSKLLNKQPPFKIDLLVVTHCHSDHIGCLPELMRLGDLQPLRALVADEKLGFGIADNGDAPMDGLSDEQRGLAIALQEEDHSDMDDPELEQFVFDAARLLDSYADMLLRLGSKAIRYGRDPDSFVQALEKEFSEFGLKIIGPTVEHLLLCADMIAHTVSPGVILQAAKAANDMGKAGNAGIYRNMTRSMLSDSAAIGFDRPGIGAAKNNQSIVLSVSESGLRALLGGDMQFAQPEVPGLDTYMKPLLKKVNDLGPYEFIKLTHHSSYNGADRPMLEAWNRHTPLFAHTGGKQDPSHPDTRMLKNLKALQSNLAFARTDRNGIITVEMVNGNVTMNISRGTKNDFSPNEAAKKIQVVAEEPNMELPISAGNPIPAALAANKPIDEMVEVTAKIPHTSTRVTINIDIDHEKKNSPLTTDIKLEAPTGKRFADILFVTCTGALAGNIGITEATDLVGLVKSLPDSAFLDLPQFCIIDAAAALVRKQLDGSKYRGVIILGGYDVVPSHQLNTLDDGLRQRITDAGNNSDADNFIVWSDDIYGDKDGDGLPELPVSRLPDAKTPSLIKSALLAPAFIKKTKLGLRNLARPFADMVYDIVPGDFYQMNTSEAFDPASTFPSPVGSAVYLMLHGSDMDGTRFWGERAGGRLIEGLSINNLPHLQLGSVIFTGCCWGALTVEPAAYRKTGSTSLRPRLPEESIALTYLSKGALAFIGCTGSHYSPVKPPFDTYGKPMHDYFWQEVAQGRPPADALFHAKKRYAAAMPHGIVDPFGQAAEIKILRQYTCLGLGW